MASSVQEALRIRSIVILGGGTAGWMSAAALVRALGKTVSITVVESQDIGVVGVGEATIPPIKLFNAMLGIDEAQFMRETMATHKLGIDFHGWGHEDSHYFHPFGTFGLQAELGHFFQYWLRLKLQGHALDLGDYSLCAQAAKKGVFGTQGRTPQDPLAHLGSAYHFDAVLYGQFLRRYSENLGVKRIEGVVTRVDQASETGFVTGLCLKDGQSVEGDFFIDCSGFKGVLIEETLKAGYEDWSDLLPMDRAVAVPCALKGPLTPYTQSTAREAGWQWRIPLQHRVGNGYVYSSRFIEDGAATETLLKNLESEPLAEPRPLRFTTGRRKKLWSKNVVAVGLSSGFLEPLESTSIHLIQSSLNKLLQFFPDKTCAQALQDAYNHKLRGDLEHIRDFLVVHYHATQRQDAPLWRYVQSMPIPDSLKLKLELFKASGQLLVQSDEMFSQTSWLAVLIGQNQSPISYSPLVATEDEAALASGFASMKAHLSAVVQGLPSHKDYLVQHHMMAQTQ